MGRKKVTYEIDEALVRSVKLTAIAESKPEYAVVEEALRQKLLAPVLKQIWANVDPMEPEEAMDLVRSELQELRQQDRE